MRSQRNKLVQQPVIKVKYLHTFRCSTLGSHGYNVNPRLERRRNMTVVLAVVYFIGWRIEFRSTALLFFFTIALTSKLDALMLAWTYGRPKSKSKEQVLKTLLSESTFMHIYVASDYYVFQRRSLGRSLAISLLHWGKTATAAESVFKWGNCTRCTLRASLSSMIPWVTEVPWRVRWDGERRWPRRAYFTFIGEILALLDGKNFLSYQKSKATVERFEFAIYCLCSLYMQLRGALI